MAVAQLVTTPPLVTTAEPQIIPTNAGLRTFASPPGALQKPIVPNDLFYVRNHWKESPDIDIATYRLKVDGEVERTLSLSFADLRKLPREAFPGDLRVLRQQSGTGILHKVPAHQLGHGADQRPRHYGQRRMGRGLLAGCAGTSRRQGLGCRGDVRGRRSRSRRSGGRPGGGHL